MRTPAVLLSLLVLTGCHAAEPGAVAAPSADVGADEAPLAVTSAVAEAMEVPVVLDVRGQVITDRQARMAAGATGRVVEVLVERGATVREGDVIARLDGRLLTASRDEAKAALAQAEANLRVADDDCERGQALYERGLSNDAALLKARGACATAQASADAARARLAAAEVRLADTRIRAPFAGVVEARLVSPGEYVRDDSSVVVLVGTADLRLELTIGEREASRVQGGEDVVFRVAGDARDRRARVDRVSPSLDASGRDLVVEATVDAADAADLRVGAFVRGGVQTGARPAVAVPEAAVVRDGAATRAWVIASGRAEERVVAVGQAVDGRLPVLDGLVAGEAVISPVPAGLRDGRAVEER